MRNTIALVACTAASFSLSLSVVRADALLFPYVVTSNSVASIISTVNTDPQGNLFHNYLVKDSLAHTATCTSQLRRKVGSAQNDLVSFDVNGKFKGNISSATGGPLFNDPAGTAQYAGNNFTMGPVTEAKRAFLIMDDNTNTGENLYGEALILETQGGAAWGYRAYNPADDFGGVAAPNNPIFSAAQLNNITSPTNDNLGEVLDTTNNTDNAPVALLPSKEWQTSFFVTPVSAGDQRLCTNCNAAIKLIRSKNNETSNGLFDRDANPLVGSNTVEVICVSGVSLDDLLPANLKATVETQGGWGYLDVDQGSAGGIAVPAAIVMKLEFNKVQFISPDSSNTFTGTVNTALWLRNRDNTEGTSGF